MTANQINYGRLKEDIRNHRVLEVHSGQQAQAALSQASTAAIRASEEARANREKERVNWWNALEQGRHNQVTESTERYRVESLADYQRIQSSVLQRQAAVSERQAAVQEGTLAEMIANNAAVRQETQRANIARENWQMQQYEEAARANRANEQISRDRNLLTQNQLYEIQRSNLANEAIKRLQISEQSRSNRAQESLESSRIEETRRSNIAREVEANRSNLANELLQNQRNAETHRSNVAVEKETRLHNQASEQNDAIRARSTQIQAVARAVEAVPGIAKDLMMLIGGLTS